jgi:LPS-assembly protein
MPGSKTSVAGYFFGHGVFDYNDTWRYGFNINLGSSVSYLRDFQVPGYGTNLLASSIYVEGFGVGSYTKLDIRAYQGLNTDISQNLLPYVLPRYQYSYFGEPDGLGGRLSLYTTEWNVLRDKGTNDQQAAVRAEWNRPFSGRLGDQWLFTLQGTGVAYNATVADGQPNYLDNGHGSGVTGQAQAAIRLNWPFVRDDGYGGYQVIEPILQVIAAPQHGASLRDHVPNEDSLDYEFTDTTLFSLNRFGGFDRFDGGVRVNAALRGEWDIVLGQRIEGLVGLSYEQHIDANLYPYFQPWNGFERGDHLSDIVGRLSYYPNSWVEIAARTRVDHDNGDIRFGDAIATVGHPIFKVNVGYIYSSTDPYQLYVQNINLPGFFNPYSKNIFINGVPQSFFTPRSEITLGASSHLGQFTLGGNAIRDIQTNQMVGVGANLKWENECTIFDIFANRRYTSIAGDNGDTTVLFTLTLKTIGGFGVNG